MVLESLFSAKKIERNPWDMLILSIIVTLVCIYISHVIFPEYAGIITPLLVTVTMTPIIFMVFKIDEGMVRQQARHKIEKSFWDRHDETIVIFTMFFIGSFLAIFFVSLVAPEAFVTSAFSQQIDAINAINPPTAQVINTAESFLGTGSFMNSSLLQIILFNNLKVMFFAFLLSFLIGTGALFILSWNASVLAIYLAMFLREGLYQEFLLRSLGIAPHAPIEILSYFLAGIAGGILSVGVIREKINSKSFKLVFKDSLKLLALAVIAVILGAFIEVFI